jgi:threonine/homoserine/homoserine lactone efflux protein
VLEIMDFFYRGLILGVMISAPVGPIGLLCIRRTAQRGLLIGFATGMGAAAADAIFGAIATFGVAAILTLVEGYQTQIKLMGALILAGMAWHAWRKKPNFTAPQDIKASNVVGAFLSGLVLTCTNPVTILAVMAVIASLSGSMTTIEAGIMTGGIFAGAAAWWAFLSAGVALFRKRFTERTLLFINRCTAILLCLVAVYALVTGLQDYGLFGLQQAPLK